MVWHFDHLSAYMSRGAGGLWDGVKEQPCQNAVGLTPFVTEYHKFPFKKCFHPIPALKLRIQCVSFGC